MWLQNLCHTERDRHFIGNVTLCSGHPKMCKYFKNWNSKSFTIPIIPSYYRNIREALDRTRKVYGVIILVCVSNNSCHRNYLVHFKLDTNAYLYVKLVA